MWKSRAVLPLQKQKIPSLSIAEYLSSSGLVLVDVRRSDEYAQGSIPDSLHLELAEILDGHWQDLLPYKEKGIVLQCRSGMRSLKAAEFLAEQGFERLWNLEGGILAYKKSMS